MREALRHLLLENQMSPRVAHVPHVPPTSRKQSAKHIATTPNNPQPTRKETSNETESKLEIAGAPALGGGPPRTARRNRRRHCELRKRMLFADAKRQDTDDGRVCLRHSRHRRDNAVPPDRRQRRQRHECRRAVEPGGGEREVKDKEMGDGRWEMGDGRCLRCPYGGESRAAGTLPLPVRRQNAP